MQCLFSLTAMPRKIEACRWLVMASVRPQGRHLQVRAYDIKLVSDSSPTHLTQNMGLEHGEGFWKGRWASKKEPPDN